MTVPLIQEFWKFKEKKCLNLFSKEKHIFRIIGKHCFACILHLLRLQQPLCLASDLKSLYEIVGGKAYPNPGNNSRNSQ